MDPFCRMGSIFCPYLDTRIVHLPYGGILWGVFFDIERYPYIKKNFLSSRQ